MLPTTSEIKILTVGAHSASFWFHFLSKLTGPEDDLYLVAGTHPHHYKWLWVDLSSMGGAPINPTKSFTWWKRGQWPLDLTQMWERLAITRPCKIHKLLWRNQRDLHGPSLHVTDHFSYLSPSSVHQSQSGLFGWFAPILSAHGRDPFVNFREYTAIHFHQ